jgi:hypothetical protein
MPFSLPLWSSLRRNSAAAMFARSERAGPYRLRCRKPFAYEALPLQRASCALSIAVQFQRSYRSFPCLDVEWRPTSETPSFTLFCTLLRIANFLASSGVSQWVSILPLCKILTHLAIASVAESQTTSEVPKIHAVFIVLPICSNFNQPGSAIAKIAKDGVLQSPEGFRNFCPS